ncbi:MAG: NUDIX hydrolase [Spirulinaceae cyanobacterium]
MGKKKRIRVIALGLIRHGDRIFVSEGYDSCKKDNFYRALGGGVEFGETSLEALEREFQEEIQAELTNIKFLGCLENVFICDEEAGHEIIQLYQCDFKDRKFYELTEMSFHEGKKKKKALWVDINKLRSGELRLVPQEFSAYLD